jgi:hypothetical protein
VRADLVSAFELIDVARGHGLHQTESTQPCGDSLSRAARQIAAQ